MGLHRLCTHDKLPPYVTDASDGLEPGVAGAKEVMLSPSRHVASLPLHLVILARGALSLEDSIHQAGIPQLPDLVGNDGGLGWNPVGTPPTECSSLTELPSLARLPKVLVSTLAGATNRLSSLPELHSHRALGAKR